MKICFSSSLFPHVSVKLFIFSFFDKKIQLHIIGYCQDEEVVNYNFRNVTEQYYSNYLDKTQAKFLEHILQQFLCGLY